RLNVGQIVAVSTLSRSAVSHHLKLLKEAGVLKSEKIGKEVFYWINREFLEDSLGAVLAFLRSKT
ncbi:MAG: ArsR/SmtB family transcription factor, partial [Usitatibacter sp.]